MKHSGDLKRAGRYFSRGKYGRVIRLLEPQIFRYRENAYYYYYLGTSCLKTGDVGGAGTYLRRTVDIQPGHVNARLALAVVHLRRRETDKALEQILQVLDDEPGNRYARRALATLRRNPSPDEVGELVERGKVDRLLPVRRRVLPGVLLWLAIAAAVSTGLYFGGLELFRRLDSPVRHPEVRALSIEGERLISSDPGSFRLILTEKEIEEAFRKAKRYFADYRDNLSQREINRILASNASLRIKTQAETIAQYIVQPDFTTIRDVFSYAEVAAQPYLYNNCFVVWRGRISNLVVGETAISFDLLVGYQDGTVLEGIVSVNLDFAARLDQGVPIEVLGRVVTGEDGTIRLQGLSLHRLMPR